VSPLDSKTGGRPEHEEDGEHECPERIAEAPAVREARILGGRCSERVRRDGRALRVRLELASTSV